MSVQPNITDRRYFLQLIELIREATQKCSEKSAQWNALNDEFNDHYKRQYPGRMILSDRSGAWVPVDPVHYSQGKKVNLPLADAEAGWSHWEREVKRLSAALEAEYTVRKLLTERFTNAE